ncbi:hypothetical protein D3C80_1202130 [compost metagenome]
MCSRHEPDLVKLERMAAKASVDVHLETVEEAENQGTEPAQAGDTGVAGLPVGKHTSGILALPTRFRLT